MSCQRDRIFSSPCQQLITPRRSTSGLTLQQPFKDETNKSPSGFKATDETSQTFPLTDLPNELIDHVVAFLDSEAPSEVTFNEHPSAAYTNAADTPLKDMARISQRFRSLILPRLFAHVRLDPYKLTPFLAFLHQKDLAKHVKTIVAQLQGPCNHLHPAWWARLLNEVPACTFTISCAPHVFAELVNTSVASADAWAFNMSHQLLKLRQAPESVNERISLADLPSLFAARQWVDLSVNEGSSLKAYTTYEYFLRRTPSLLGTMHARKLTMADSMFADLQSFTFTAIFPFYNHVDEILKSVRKMKKLKLLRTKLCPEPHSTVLNDEIEAAGGHFDVNDPWNEFDTGYSLVAHTVLFLTVEGQLQEFHVDDIKMAGIRDKIEESVTQRLQELWLYQGEGIWARRVDA